ncbi:hypothetical protein H6G97_30825 [Nostoc flagelliforme FACHB-838]|uniref:Uncharacterized protein n=1 Tax=Nostoc flagelliforme FACHB-838 TaxID=2692904 RepID=A0ABR8DZA4_9NOSO|nr:hypothetical protein [Nostoc flagelliforme]MBD2533713.1 hypothetical protein [Nostoc flagelliforme FACHB-838]
MYHYLITAAINVENHLKEYLFDGQDETTISFENKVKLVVGDEFALPYKNCLVCMKLTRVMQYRLELEENSHDQRFTLTVKPGDYLGYYDCRAEIYEYNLG